MGVLDGSTAGSSLQAGYAAFALRTGIGDTDWTWLTPSKDAANPAPPTPAWALKLPISATASTGLPPGIQHYSNLRDVKFNIEREYAGINSSGGPQQAGRADHSDLTIERASDDLSGNFLDSCCNGVPFAWIHIALVQDQQLIYHLVAKDSNVTDYNFRSKRYIGTSRSDSVTTTTDAATNLVTGSSASTFYEPSHSYKNAQIEVVSFVYTSISLVHHTSPDYDGGHQGSWNTGTNDPTM